MRSRLFLWCPLSVVLLSLLLTVPAYSQETTASDKPVQLITGLDEGNYEPYSPATVKAVQEALTKEGLYKGEISGKLDKETMEALGEYQRKNQLAVSGVPTPKTRALLLRPANAT